MSKKDILHSIQTILPNIYASLEETFQKEWQDVDYPSYKNEENETETEYDVENQDVIFPYHFNYVITTNPTLPSFQELNLKHPEVEYEEDVDYGYHNEKNVSSIEELNKREKKDFDNRIYLPNWYK
jgi:hypothetical protein